MGLIERGDEDLHYSDGSTHCWIAPVGIDQKVWEAGLRAHLARHNAGGEVEQVRRSPRDQPSPKTTGPGVPEG